MMKLLVLTMVAFPFSIATATEMYEVYQTKEFNGSAISPDDPDLMPNGPKGEMLILNQKNSRKFELKKGEVEIRREIKERKVQVRDLKKQIKDLQNKPRSADRDLELGDLTADLNDVEDELKDLEQDLDENKRDQADLKKASAVSLIEVEKNLTEFLTPSMRKTEDLDNRLKKMKERELDEESKEMVRIAEVFVASAKERKKERVTNMPLSNFRMM